MLPRAAYAAFTLSVVKWRATIRGAMNRAEAEAAGRAVDSLLNYETVKYFNAEQHEARRWGAEWAADAPCSLACDERLSCNRCTRLGAV